MRAVLGRRRVPFSIVLLTQSAMPFPSRLCGVVVIGWVPKKRAASCTAADTNYLELSEWMRAGAWPKAPVVYSIDVQMACRESLVLQSGIKNMKRVESSVNVAS